MGKYRNLDWAWKPDEQTVEAEKRARYKRKVSRKNARRRKQGKRPLTAHEKLLIAPGSKFYRSKKWRSLRKRVFLRYGYRCMKCRAVDTEFHVDHIVPRSKAPHLSLTLSNLQVLCRDCNMEKMNRNSNDYRERVVSEDLDIEQLANLREML